MIVVIIIIIMMMMAVMMPHKRRRSPFQFQFDKRRVYLQDTFLSQERKFARQTKARKKQKIAYMNAKIYFWLTIILLLPLLFELWKALQKVTHIADKLLSVRQLKKNNSINQKKNEKKRLCEFELRFFVLNTQKVIGLRLNL